MPVEAGRTADVALVEAVLRRDRKATAEFVSRHSDQVYSYVRHRLSPRADLVDDVVQDVFLAAWQRLSEYRHEAPLRNWLLGIARHKVEDHYRGRLREPLELPEGEGLPPGMRLDPEWDDQLDRQQVYERTQRVMASLPEIYSLVLLWRYWEKRSTREMAELTGKTEKAVERLLARARENFKRRWNNE